VSTGAIFGILGDAGAEELAAMDARLRHRGAAGAHWSPAAGVHLGLRSEAAVVARLAGGPLVFDGAVDNRRELAKLTGRPASFTPEPADDGPLLLELLHLLGPDGLHLVAGQMAVGWWDPKRGALLLARDRLGYGPLHFTVDRAGRFVFASEYKALLALDTVDARPDRDAIQVIQSTKWTKPGATCLAGVYPVAPGTWLEVSRDRMHTARYWDIPVRIEHHDEARHAATLRDRFLETMRQQTEPYRRIGVSLSGGLDSAVMAAGARQVAGDREVHTFSAGYGPDDRELVNAEQVARVLGTQHHPLVLSPQDLPGLLPWMVWHLEEPIGREDIAYLYVAAREAACHVDVVLAGFGFDGMFAGLPRHRLVDLGLKLPPARGALEEFYDYTFRSVEPHSLPGRALRQAYFRGKSWPAPRVLDARPMPPFAGFPRDRDQPLSNFLRRGFLVSPYQSAVEHLYSAVGVRMNAHHTDPAFLAAAFSIPDHLKIHGRTQKYILRKACAGLLPERILAFGKSFNRLRHDAEMSGVLDGMAEELLPREAVVARGLFDPGYVADLRRRAPGAPYTQERAYRLWSLLLTELWARSYLDRRGEPPAVELPPVRYAA
jgi:asparagine synthase (glutamine-hydrolysing)